MTEFERQAQSIFSKFTELLAKIDLRNAIALPVTGHAFVSAANGNVMATKAATTGALASALARPFLKMRARLFAPATQVQVVQKEAQGEPDAPDDEGLYAWARNRASAPMLDQDWRLLLGPEIKEPPGTVEMLRRIALAHRVDVNELEIRGQDVVWRSPQLHGSGAPKVRPICQMHSPFWRETERQIYILNRYAKANDLNANALYVRDGVVYEENPEAFVDRKVCSVDSPGWDAAHRELLHTQLGNDFDSASLEVFKQLAQGFQSSADDAMQENRSSRPRLRV